MISRLFVALLFTAYLIEQSPHLVHHLFEQDDVQADCSFLAAAERHHAAPADVTPMLATVLGTASIVPASSDAPRSHDSRFVPARAPPAVA